MWLGYQNNKIIVVKNTKKEIESIPLMEFDKIVKTNEKYI